MDSGPSSVAGHNHEQNQITTSTPISTPAPTPDISGMRAQILANYTILVRRRYDSVTISQLHLITLRDPLTYLYYARILREIRTLLPLELEEDGEEEEDYPRVGMELKIQREGSKMALQTEALREMLEFTAEELGRVALLGRQAGAPSGSSWDD